MVNNNRYKEQLAHSTSHTLYCPVELHAIGWPSGKFWIFFTSILEFSRFDKKTFWANLGFQTSKDWKSIGACQLQEAAIVCKGIILIGVCLLQTGIRQFRIEDWKSIGTCQLQEEKNKGNNCARNVWINSSTDWKHENCRKYWKVASCHHSTDSNQN